MKKHSRRSRNPLLSTLLFALCLTHAHAQRVTTVAVFADRPMPDAQWTALFNSIKSELPAQAEEETAHLSLLRGDRILPGLVVDDAVSVYLHGDCSKIPSVRSHTLPASPHPRALGWVELTNGRIPPFIHIDCTLVAQMICVPSHFFDDKSGDLFSLAVARVFLHEWLHVFTQSPHHARTGITKSEFSVADLIGAPSARHGQPMLGTAGSAHGK